MSGQLDALRRDLSRQDLVTLELLHRFRLMETRQLARLNAPRHATAASALRQASRTLQRLAAVGVVQSLPRRVGGTRKGSAAMVWSLTPVGAGVLGHESRRYRMLEPSSAFLEHTVAIAELFVQLQELEHDGRLAITSVQTEPTSWRRYQDAHGVATLKPDLAVTLQAGDFEDRWFLEADRATENPGRIVAACRRYQQYRATSTEQRANGVFPMVAWIVPDQARVAQLRRHLNAEPAIDQRLFVVATVNDFRQLMTTGPP